VGDGAFLILVVREESLEKKEEEREWGGGGVGERGEKGLFPVGELFLRRKLRLGS